MTSKFLRLRRPGHYVWAHELKEQNSSGFGSKNQSKVLLFWDNCREYTHFACPTQRYADILIQKSLSKHFFSHLDSPRSSSFSSFQAVPKDSASLLAFELSSKYDRYFNLLKNIRETKMIQNFRETGLQTIGIVEEIHSQELSMYVPDWDITKVPLIAPIMPLTPIHKNRNSN